MIKLYRINIKRDIIPLFIVMYIHFSCNINKWLSLNTVSLNIFDRVPVLQSCIYAQSNEQGAVARAVAMPLGMQAVPRSIPVSGTFFCEDLVMEIFQRPFFLSR